MVTPSTPLLVPLPGGNTDRTESPSASVQTSHDSAQDTLSFAAVYDRTRTQRDAPAPVRTARPTPPTRETAREHAHTEAPTSHQTESDKPPVRDEADTAPDQEEKPKDDSVKKETTDKETPKAPTAPTDVPALVAVAAQTSAAIAITLPAVAPGAPVILTTPVAPTVPVAVPSLPAAAQPTVIPATTQPTVNTPANASQTVTTTANAAAPVLNLRTAVPAPTITTTPAAASAATIPTTLPAAPMDSRTDANAPVPGVGNATPSTAILAVPTATATNTPPTHPTPSPVETTATLKPQSSATPAPAAPLVQRVEPTVTIETAPAAATPEQTASQESLPVESGTQKVTRQQDELRRMLTLRTPQETPAQPQMSSHPVIEPVHIAPAAATTRTLVTPVAPAPVITTAPVSVVQETTATLVTTPFLPVTSGAAPLITFAVTPHAAAEAKEAELVPPPASVSGSSPSLVPAAVAAPAAATPDQGADSAGQQTRQETPSPEPRAIVAGGNRQQPGSIETQPTTASAPTTGNHAERAHIIEQVTRHLETMRLTNGNGELSLRLRPEHLGSLRLTISSQPEGVVARIVTETVQAQQAMEGSKEQLRAALETKGLHLSRLDVSVGQGAVPDGQAAFAGTQERSQERVFQRASAPQTTATRDTEPALPTVEAPRSRAAHSTSRLDYRA